MGAGVCVGGGGRCGGLVEGGGSLVGMFLCSDQVITYSVVKASNISLEDFLKISSQVKDFLV